MTFIPYDPNQHQNPNQDGDDFDPPADGQHKGCELIDAGAFTSKKGDDWAKFKWRTPNGHEWTVLQGFDPTNDTRTAITWGQIQALGINPVDIDSLEALNTILIAQVGSYYDLGVKTNGQFRNTYINGPTVGENPVVQQQIANGAQPVAAGTGVPEEDIPFACAWA